LEQYGASSLYQTYSRPLDTAHGRQLQLLCSELSHGLVLLRMPYIRNMDQSLRTLMKQRLNMERLPLDVNLNDNAKTAVVAIAGAIVALAVMNILRLMFRSSNDE